MSGGGSGDTVKLTIGGSVSGQVAAGRDIRQVQFGGGLTEEDVRELRLAIAGLRKEVVTAAPLELQEEALKQVGTLEEAVSAPKPDVSKLARVRDWFVKNLPSAAGAVSSVIVGPIVGRLVEAAGDVVSAEFKKAFGGSGTEQ